MDFLSLREIFPEENTLSFMFTSVNRNLLERRWRWHWSERRENVRIIVSLWHKRTTTTKSEVKEKPGKWSNGETNLNLDWVICQELLTTWSMTFSYIFSAISLRSWDVGNEETKLIVMKYRALWVTALGRLSRPACSQQMHFTQPLWNRTFEYQSFSHQKVRVPFFFSQGGMVSHDWILFFSYGH